MKSVLYILLGVCCCHCLPSVISRDDSPEGPPASESFFDKKMREKLEQLKIEMKTGVSFLNNTILDPLILVKNSSSLNVNGLVGNISVEDFRLDNLSAYDVKSAKFNMSTPWNVEVGLSWPGEIKLKTKYDLDVWVSYLYHVFGKGELELKVGNLQFYVSTYLTVEDYLQIDIKKLNINLDQLRFRITGLFDDDDLSAILGDIVNELVPDLLKEYQGEVIAFVLDYAEDYLNERLKEVPLEDITAIIMG